MKDLPTTLARHPAPRQPGGRLPVGWRCTDEAEALYGAFVIVRQMVPLTLQKRQPARTGRRSPGAFGLIPGGSSAHPRSAPIGDPR
ncbi:MAG: hypothetical protein JXQ91_19795 [Vannielia sp.]|uniref:hypothetical protein n=1 Tax=Vannielia sp. TaxID=2813045 RepID=UPI003B8BBC04